MKKILFFPFLRMPSGHHQVADTLARYIEKRTTADCKKIDLLSEWNPLVETAVTRTYLHWIHYSPKTYEWAYRQFAYSSPSNHSFKWYELLFRDKMDHILSAERPDLIICTHCFPSRMISRLKALGRCEAPVINVYTDFFINDVWAREGIDGHFVANRAMKDRLMETARIPEKRVFVTGIPVDERFEWAPSPSRENSPYEVLVSGGNTGLGKIFHVLKGAGKSSRVRYLILCGNNKKLYEELSRLNSDHIRPLPYISSRSRMNELYNRADAIVTKPGGVTVSEALKKGVPIFVHSALPGQEEINLHYLKRQNLVCELDNSTPAEEQIIRVLNNRREFAKLQKAGRVYREQMELETPEEIYRLIKSRFLVGRSPFPAHGSW